MVASAIDAEPYTHPTTGVTRAFECRRRLRLQTDHMSGELEARAGIRILLETKNDLPFYQVQISNGATNLNKTLMNAGAADPIGLELGRAVHCQRLALADAPRP